MGLCITGLGFASAALAGPQHWGFGFGYLVTVEQNERGQRALSVYEPPLRVKDGAWLLRWRDTSEQYKDVIPGAVAVGAIAGRDPAARGGHRWDRLATGAGWGARILGPARG